MTLHDNPAPIGASDPFNLAASFLSAIAPGETVFDFRAFHDQRRDLLGVSRRGTLRDCWHELIALNGQGYGIFCLINETDGTGGKLGNITGIRAQFLDLDQVDASDQLQRAAVWYPAPAFYVQTSPNRFHVYWKVQPYQGSERFTINQRKLAVMFNGDPSVIDAARVMRLPGFHNRKGVPVMVTCAALSGYGTQVVPELVEAALAGVQVAAGGIGQRIILGDPEQAAPSLQWLQLALDSADPNGMDRAAWISFTASVKQAGWTLADEPTLFAMWLNWCARYEGNDPDENEKQWRSIRDSQLGWKSIVRRVPNVAAHLQFGGRSHGQIIPATSKNIKDYLDHEQPVSTQGKPVSSELYRFLKEYDLPIRYDAFKCKITITGKMPWDQIEGSFPRPWSDAEETYLQALFQREPGCGRVTKDATASAVMMYADRRQFNPVTEYLNDLQWDFQPRLDGLFSNYFKAENAEFANIISAKFLIGMVARAMVPGCKRDEMPVIEGAQGAMKSSALAILAGDAYFSDGLPNMKDKEAMQHLQGQWLCEVGELAALRKGEIDEAKRFISARVDKFRPPYGRHVIESKRTCVFAGTTNEDEYLKDATGARRFWPVRCGGLIDLDGLRRDRDQLFAEAVTRWRLGEPYWLDQHQTELGKLETDARQIDDLWHQPVKKFVDGHSKFGTEITMDMIVRIALGQTAYNPQDRFTTGRVAAILKRLGYRRVQQGRGGPWYYRKS